MSSGIKVTADGTHALATVEPCKYFSDDGSVYLIRPYAVRRDVIAEQKAEVDDFSVFKGFSDTPFLIFTG